MLTNNTTVLCKVNTYVVSKANTKVLILEVMNYGERLRAARKYKKWSQEKLALISGVGQGSISKIERGDQETSTFDIELADALNVSPNWLKTGNPDYAPEWLGGKEKNANSQPDIPDISNLMPTASPRTQAMLKAIDQAYQEGRLTDEDLDLLESIARRLSHDPSRTNR